MIICPHNNPHCNYKLSPMAKEDFPTTVKFLNKTFPHMEHDLPLWKNYIERNGDNILLKNSRNKIQGYMNIEKINGKRTINFISVHPSLQGQGIGSKLLQYAEKKYTDASEFFLHTEGNKIENMKFYEKNGWRISSINPKGYAHTTSVEFSKKVSS